MTKQQFKEKLINKMVFIHKIKDKNIINNLMDSDFEEITLLHTQMLPLPKTLKEYHNQFIWIKRHCDYVTKSKAEYSRKLHKFKDDYSKFIKETGAKNISDFTPEQYKFYELLLTLIDLAEKDLEVSKDNIIDLNNKLEYICDYYDKINLPLSEFASLCGINYVNAKINTEDINMEDYKHWSYLFHGIEDANEEDGWKSNRNGMPIFHLTTMNFIIMMERNKELKVKVDDYIHHTMGLAGSMMTLKTDEDGNQTMEKYYPPLKVLE